MLNNDSLIFTALNECRDFNALTEKEKLEIIPACRVIHLKAGQDVFSIEHQRKYFFIVLLGRQSLQLRKRTGFFGPGDLFGEIVLFSQGGRLGSIHCEEDSTLVIMDKNFIHHPGLLHPELRVKLLLILGKKMASYFYKNAPLPIKELLEKDESYELEFKQSYSTKVRTKIHETVIAFMNTRGGSLLLGVDDNKKAVGIKLKNSFDQFKNNFCNNIKSITNKSAGSLIDVDIDKIGEATVVRVIVQPSNRPVLFNTDNKKNRLYVRQDGQTAFLTNPIEIISYGQERFNL